MELMELVAAVTIAVVRVLASAASVEVEAQVQAQASRKDQVAMSPLIHVRIN